MPHTLVFVFHKSLQFFKYSDKIQNFKLWNLQIFENSLSLLELAIFLQKSTLQFEICKYLKIPSLLEFALFCKKFEFVLIFRIFKSFLNIQTKFIHFKNLQNILILNQWPQIRIFGHSILYTEATQQQSSKSRQRHFCIIEIVSSTYTKIELMSGLG